MNMLSGIASGTTTFLLMYPLDLVNTIVTAEVGKSLSFNSILDSVTQITKHSGFFGLYSGVDANILEVLL